MVDDFENKSSHCRTKRFKLNQNLLETFSLSLNFPIKQPSSTIRSFWCLPSQCAFLFRDRLLFASSVIMQGNPNATLAKNPLMHLHFHHNSYMNQVSGGVLLPLTLLRSQTNVPRPCSHNSTCLQTAHHDASFLQKSKNRIASALKSLKHLSGLSINLSQFLWQSKKMSQSSAPFLRSSSSSPKLLRLHSSGAVVFCMQRSRYL